MTNLLKTAAVSLTLVGASSVAFADGHADIEALTCAEFAAMEIADQQSSIIALAAMDEEIMKEDTKIGDILVLCNGSDEETVAAVLTAGTDS